MSSRLSFPVLLGLALLLGLAATTADAADIYTYHRLCYDEELKRPIPIAPELVVPGCEVVDCCPGCPGPPDFLDWAIRLDPGIDHLDLRFDADYPAAPGEIGVEGPAEWIDESTLRIYPGETVLTGVYADPDDPGVVWADLGSLEPSATGEPMLRTRLTPELSSAGMAEETGVFLQQLYDGVLVNGFEVRLEPFPCGPRSVRLEDQIVLDNNLEQDDALILVDGTREAISGSVNVDDEIRRTAGGVFLGNMLESLFGTARDEVVVMSDQNAFYIADDPTWTPAVGEVHRAELEPRVDMPVHMWHLSNVPYYRVFANWLVAEARLDEAHVGVRFLPEINPWPETTALTVSCSRADLDFLRGFRFVPDRLNVYFVDRAFSSVRCINEPNVVFIGSVANITTLAHQIGHHFSLGHVNGLPGFGNDNLMWAGAPVGSRNLTAGQVFRANTNKTSMLNANGFRVGPIRSCPDHVADAVCPSLDLDDLPH